MLLSSHDDNSGGVIDSEEAEEPAGQPPFGELFQRGPRVDPIDGFESESGREYRRAQLLVGVWGHMRRVAEVLERMTDIRR